MEPTESQPWAGLPDEGSRVAVLTPPGRGAEIITAVLTRHGVACRELASLDELAAGVGSFGAAIVTEEAVQGSDPARLARVLEGQPAWSDLPLVLVTVKGGDEERDPVALAQMQSLGNVTFLERPFHATTLVSLVRTALSSRSRQYQSRDRLRALEASRERLARSDERLTFALKAGGLGAWDIGLADSVLTTSDLCKAQFGRAPQDPFTYADFLSTIDPRDRERQRAAVAAATADGGDYEVEYRINTPSGENRWIEIRGRASFEDGVAVRMAGVSLDITARKQADERQQLLIRELHHRVKNTLSTVQAILGSTARSARSVEQFYEDFSGRIMSLANTHTLLTEELWQRALLGELLAQELGPYRDGGSRVILDGPEVELPSSHAVPLAMAFHELATNAAKYGSLSAPEGRVAVRWWVAGGGAGPRRLRLDWREEGGPPVEAPTRQGFGSRLIDRVLSSQVRAEVSSSFDRDGLRVALSFDLPETAGTW